jgi:VIT1/CCC1 family predicted Fe2+/Mn2+ transporter
VRDVAIGMADGLTVPFALAAGLSAAVSSTKIIFTAGLAEIVAGAIAMGLGGYLAARTNQEHYASEERREVAEVQNLREREVAEVESIFRQYGLSGEPLRQLVHALTSDRKSWVEFMMRFELGLERPDPNRAPISAATIAAPYFAFQALIVLTTIALLLFGAIKGRLTGPNVVKASLQTAAVGGLAAAAASYLAHLLG